MTDHLHFKELIATRAFWNSSPCSGQDTFEDRKKLRFRAEPWLPKMLQKIAADHSDIFEIGCGQGTDALIICSYLPENGSYKGIDYSTESIANAKKALVEYEETLPVTPKFEVGNGEVLLLGDDSTDYIYSFGVLHHTANEQVAFEEVYRTLKPGGEATIILYRKWSLKVITAILLRKLQSFLDVIFRKDKCLYKILHGRHLEYLLGTMLLECFGVPFLKAYTEKEIRVMFSRFKIKKLYPIGYSIPWIHSDPDALTPLGYYWLIEIEKPTNNQLGSGPL